MIRFQISSDLTPSKVLFGARPGGGLRGWKDQERELLYGFRCQYCSNPIAFAFLTEKKLNLGRFEETRVVNGERDCREVIPNPDSQYSSAYDIEFTEIPGKTMGIERVYMKNHVLKVGNVGTSEPFEPGERCCPYVGVFSHRYDLLIRDTIIMGGFKASDFHKYDLPDWEKFSEIIEGDHYHYFLHGVTTPAKLAVPPMVMCRMDWLKPDDGEGAKGASHWRGKLLIYKKSATAQGDVPEVADEF